MNPFDFINAITFTKENLFTDKLADKDYDSYMVNKGLSYFSDTVMYANEMNRLYDIPTDQQFNFLINTITKRKRFSKWVKKDADTKSIALVKEYYKYSNEKAKQALQVLTQEDLDIIKTKLFKGGAKNDRDLL